MKVMALKSKLWAKLRWFFLSAQALLLLALLSAILLLSTDYGRRWLVHLGVDYVNEADNGLEIRYKKLRTDSLGHWRFQQLQLFREQKLWLQIDDLALDISVRALRDKRIHLKHLSAAQLHYFHTANAPQSSDSEKATTQSLNLQNIQWSLLVDEFAIARTQIEVGEALQIPDYKISGQLEALSERAPLFVEMSAQSLDELAAQMRFDLHSTVLATDRVRIKGSLLEEARGKDQRQGLLGRLMELPEGQPIDAELEVELVVTDEDILVDLVHVEQALLGTPILAQGKLEIRKDFSAISSEGLSLQIGEKTQSIAGQWRRSDTQQTLQAQLKLDAFPLPLLQPWLPQIKAGHVDSDTHLQLQYDGELMSMLKRLQMNSHTRFDLMLDSPHGLFALKGDTQFSAGETRLSWSQLMFSLEHAGLSTELESEGSVDLGSEYVEGELRSNGVPYELFELGAKISGQTLPPELRLDLGRLNLSGSAYYRRWQQSLSALAEIEASGTYQQNAIALNFDATANQGLWNIQKLDANFGGASLDAAGQLDPFGKDNRLQLSLAELDIDLLSQFLNQIPPDLKGSLNTTISLSDSLREPSADGRLVAFLQFPLPDEHGQFRSEALNFESDFNWKQRALKLDTARLVLVERENLELFSASASAEFETPLPALELEMHASQLPATLFASLGWPDHSGRLNLDLRMKNKSANEFSQAWLESLQFEILGSYSTAKVQQMQKSTGSRASELRWDFDLNTNRDKADQARQWRLNSKISQVEGGENLAQNEGWLNATLDIANLYNSIDGFKQIPPITINSELNLAALDFLLERDQSLRGALSANIQLGGATEKPEVTGVLQLREGAYVNDSVGLAFYDIAVDADADNSNFRIQNASANDGRGGSINANGRVHWLEPHARDAIQINAELKQLELVSRSDIQAEVEGKLALVGSFEESLLSGDLQLRPLEVSIESNPGAGIPELQVRRQSSRAEEAQSKGPKLILDLNIRADQQAFIRGRGLEAELAGQLGLKGPVEKIDYDGKFQTVRGQFELFGKRFNLERGELGFSNQSIALLVIGQYKKKDTEYRAELSVLGDKYKLELSSVPSLPDDEILARLIFGKSVQQITPLQAVQLAAAVQKLRGGGGFDPIASTRELLGVDTLNIESESTETGNAVNVGAGKYLSDNVFLELERSSDPAHPWQGNILIELTPSISLESTSGSSSEATVELLWKKDY